MARPKGALNKPKTGMTLKQIQELIRMVGKSSLTELRIEQELFKITLRTKDYTPSSSQQQQPQMIHMSAAPQMAPSAPAQAAAPAAKAESPAASKTTITIKSPMVGTFYRSSGPDKDAFVKPGDSIKPGDVICIIEAMKLFNEIESEMSGKIVKVLVDNATPVEYDQPLFEIEA